MRGWLEIPATKEAPAPAARTPEATRPLERFPLRWTRPGRTALNSTSHSVGVQDAPGGL